MKGTEASTFPESGSSELDRELRIMAELLLDIYLDKRDHRAKKDEDKPFDTPENER
jgi:hypothetical protein